MSDGRERLEKQKKVIFHNLYKPWHKNALIMVCMKWRKSLRFSVSNWLSKEKIERKTELTDKSLKTLAKRM